MQLNTHFGYFTATTLVYIIRGITQIFRAYKILPKVEALLRKTSIVTRIGLDWKTAEMQADFDQQHSFSACPPILLQYSTVVNVYTADNHMQI